MNVAVMTSSDPTDSLDPFPSQDLNKIERTQSRKTAFLKIKNYAFNLKNFECPILGFEDVLLVVAINRPNEM